jgi:hypothetical protein
MKTAPRRTWIAIASALAALSAVTVVLTHQMSEPEREKREIVALLARRASLRDSLAERLEGDPLIRLAEQDSSQIAIALSEHVLAALLQEITSRYLDRVEVDIEDLGGHGQGKFETQGFGHLTVGEWKVVVRVHEFGGVLSAGVPAVEVTGTNRLRFAIPARIRGGDGSLTLAFEWDSKSVFNVVCRDFKTTQTLHGRVLPQRHVVRGDFVLSAGPDGIVADPDFPPERFPLAMTLDQSSWSRVRAALEEQDQLLKCGLLIDPDQVIEKLRAMGARGLKFKLPRKLLRTIRLPASIDRSVVILGSSVELSVFPHQLRITPDLFWYSAHVNASRSSAGKPLPDARTASR